MCVDLEQRRHLIVTRCVIMQMKLLLYDCLEQWTLKVLLFYLFILQSFYLLCLDVFWISVFSITKSISLSHFYVPYDDIRVPTDLLGVPVSPYLFYLFIIIIITVSLDSTMCLETRALNCFRRLINKLCNNKFLLVSFISILSMKLKKE